MVNMGGEVELPVRLVDSPLLLQLGGRLSIICGGQSHLTHLDTRRIKDIDPKPVEETSCLTLHILDSSRYLYLSEIGSVSDHDASHDVSI
jgi:hypothetical protein